MILRGDRNDVLEGGFFQYNNSSSPKNAVSFNGEIMLLLLKGFQFGIHTLGPRHSGELCLKCGVVGWLWKLLLLWPLFMIC